MESTVKAHFYFTQGVIFKDRRVKTGGIKQEWQKVRRLLVSGVNPSNDSGPQSAIDDNDDFGEDFVREMLLADTLADKSAILNGTIASKLPGNCEKPTIASQVPDKIKRVTQSRISRIFDRFKIKKYNKDKSIANPKKILPPMAFCATTVSTKILPTKNDPKTMGKIKFKKTIKTAKIVPSNKRLQSQQTVAVLGSNNKQMGYIEPVFSIEKVSGALHHHTTTGKSANIVKPGHTKTDSVGPKFSPPQNTEQFVINLCKKDRQALRSYMKRRYAEDPAFGKLKLRWSKYNTSKRLTKMLSLQLPVSVFKCCNNDQRTCQCNQVIAAGFFTKVCGKSSLDLALSFLSQKRNQLYTQSITCLKN